MGFTGVLLIEKVDRNAMQCGDKKGSNCTVRTQASRSLVTPSAIAIPGQSITTSRCDLLGKQLGAIIIAYRLQLSKTNYFLVMAPFLSP